MLRCKDCGEVIKECRPNGDQLCSSCASAQVVAMRPSRYVPVPKNLRAKYIIDGEKEVT